MMTLVYVRELILLSSVLKLSISLFQTPGNMVVARISLSFWQCFCCI
jgi:hypothetical protein